MNIIAKTEKGFIIEATKDEVTEILNSVLGDNSKREINIGQKIPAIDYASSIRKLKTLSKSYAFTALNDGIKEFVSSFESLSETIEKASSL